MVIEGGEARQREIAAVELPPGVPVPLQAGGAYLVLEGLKPTSRPRAAQTIRLVFEHAGEREYRVRVRPQGLGDDTLENLRTDPLQQPGKPARTEGLDDALRTDPLLH
jgi:copper(I)-binding protein